MASPETSSPSPESLAPSPSSNPQSLIPNPSASPESLAPSPSFPTLHSPLFTVTTPTAVVTDLGTEFSVEVAQTGIVRTCVHEGVVRVAAIRKDGRTGDSRELRRGEAVCVAPDEPVLRAVVMKQDEFVRRMPDRGSIRDDFALPHDYLTEGTAGTIWSGILNADKASRLDTFPMDLGGVRQVGRLNIAVPQGAFVGWETPRRPGLSKRAPFLYVDVPNGDFEVQVQLKSQKVCEFSASGLMARRDDNNFVMASCYRFSPQDRYFAARSELAGDDQCGNDPITTVGGDFALRLVRIGNGFLAYGSTDGGQTWRPLTWMDGGNVVTRRDMTGPLQVGLWYGTFNPDAGAASFDNFRLQKCSLRQY